VKSKHKRSQSAPPSSGRTKHYSTVLPVLDVISSTVSHGQDH